MSHADKLGIGNKKQMFREKTRDIYGNGSKGNGSKGNKVSSRYGETIVDIKASNWKRVPCTRCKKQRKKCDREEPCGRCKNSNSGEDCVYINVQGYVRFKVPRRDENKNIFLQGNPFIISPAGICPPLTVRTNADFLLNIEEAYENDAYTYDCKAEFEVPEDTHPEELEKMDMQFKETLEKFAKRQGDSRALFPQTLHFVYNHHQNSAPTITFTPDQPQVTVESRMFEHEHVPTFPNSPTPPELGFQSSPELSEVSTLSPVPQYEGGTEIFAGYPNNYFPQNTGTPHIDLSGKNFQRSIGINEPNYYAHYQPQPITDEDNITLIPVYGPAMFAAAEVAWSNLENYHAQRAAPPVTSNVPIETNNENIIAGMIFQLTKDPDLFNRSYYAPDEVVFGGPRGKLERAIREYLQANGESMPGLERILPSGFDDIQAIMFEVLDLFDWQTTIATEFQALAKSTSDKPERNWRKIAVEWKSLFDKKVSESKDDKDKEYRKSDDLLRATLDEVIDRCNLAFDFESKQLQHLSQVWHRLQPRPDVVEHIAYLRSRYMVIGLSNLSFSTLTSLLQRSGYIWDASISTELLSSYMPNPDVFRFVTKKLDLEPSKIAFVGTNMLDLEAATAENITTIMTFGDGKTIRIPRRRPNVNLYLNSLNEFMTLVKSDKVSLSSGAQKADDDISADLASGMKKMSMVEASA